MNAHIQQTAVGHRWETDLTRPRPVKLVIDGVTWESPMPTHCGEASTFNQDADRIVEAVKRV